MITGCGESTIFICPSMENPSHTQIKPKQNQLLPSVHTSFYLPPSFLIPTMWRKKREERKKRFRKCCIDLSCSVSFFSSDGPLSLPPSFFFFFFFFLFFFFFFLSTLCHTSSVHLAIMPNKVFVFYMGIVVSKSRSKPNRMKC